MAGLEATLDATEAERLATDFVFTEGPLWHPDGFYYFVDVRKSVLYRMMPGRTPEIVRTETGEGNGATFDLQGRLVLCVPGLSANSRSFDYLAAELAAAGQRVVTVDLRGRGWTEGGHCRAVLPGKRSALERRPHE